MESREPKWAYNTVSGFKRQLPFQIYSSPAKMKRGNWMLINNPNDIPQEQEPDSKPPAFVEPPPYEPETVETVATPTKTKPVKK